MYARKVFAKNGIINEKKTFKIYQIVINCLVAFFYEQNKGTCSKFRYEDSNKTIRIFALLVL